MSRALLIKMAILTICIVFLFSVCLFAQVTLFEEDFESTAIGELPTGWTQDKGDDPDRGFSVQGEHDVTEWVTQETWPSYAYEGDLSMFCMENWSSVSGWPTTLQLITPVIDLTNAGAPVLNFAEMRAWDHLWPAEKYEHAIMIKASESPTGPWTLIDSVVVHIDFFEEYIEVEPIDLSIFKGNLVHLNFFTDTHVYYWRIDNVTVVDIDPAGVATDGAIISDYSLEQNYPNPFNPVTNIQFSLAQKEHVELRVFNILGNEVATLVNGELDAGPQTVSFDGNDLKSGIYFYQIKVANYTETRKMQLLK